MRRHTRYRMSSCVLVGLALALTSCVDVYRGAIIQMNVKSATPSAPGEHYALFAMVNGGAVPIERFKILDSITGCEGADPATVISVLLVQRYDDGVSAEELCETSRRLGNIDRNVLDRGALLGGIRVITDVDLSEADRLFISVEPDGDTDPAPGQVVFGGDLGDGIAPRAPRSVECGLATCEMLDPESPAFEGACNPLPSLPRERRGVRLGILLREPLPTDDCNAVEVGRVAVVPAEDETYF